MFRNSKVRYSSKAPHSMKSLRVLNTHETKKLNESVEKFQKECEKKVRKLSVEQMNLLTAQKGHNIASRRASLPVGSVISASYPSKSEERKLSCSVSDSAINQKMFFERKADIAETYASYKALLDRRTFLERINSPPVLPSIKDKNTESRAGSAMELAKEPSQPVMDNKSNTSIVEKLSSKWHQLTMKIGTEHEKVQPLPQLRESLFSPREEGPTPRRFSCAANNLKSSTKSKVKTAYLRRSDSYPSYPNTVPNKQSKGTLNSCKDKGDLVKQMESLKKCRYLRHLPSSLEEIDEYNIDTVFERPDKL